MYRVEYSLVYETNEIIEQVFINLPNGGVQSFPNVESNDGPERAAYLEWLAAGNEPEVIK